MNCGEDTADRKKRRNGKEKIMKIAIDIDDTLTRIDRAAAVGKYIKENGLSFRIVDPHAHTLLDVCDWSRDDVARFIKSGGDKLFLNAPLREGARETVEKWKAAGHEIIILTARISEWFQDPVNKSRRQLDEYKIPYDEIVAEVWEKGRYCRDRGIEVLIEDNFEICKKAQELGVKAVMFVDKHNFAHAKEIKYAGPNWEYVASSVEFILNPPRERG